MRETIPKSRALVHIIQFGELLNTCFYFILSSETNAYEKQIKVISITSEMIYPPIISL